MLSRIRKFSSSIFAKIFLIIIAIPFIFWGMGPLFTGGNLNVIAQIGKNKISTQEFVNFLKQNRIDQEIADSNAIEKLLSNFIGKKLIEEEVKDFKIKLSDKSLTKIIKNEDIFKKDNKFSRTKYEKFLVENSLDAITLENNIALQNKEGQFFDYIGGGLMPPKFLVNIAFNKENQKRNIQTIDLNNILQKKFNFSNKEIKSFYDENKNLYIDTQKSVKFVNLDPQNLTGNEEYTDKFFQNIDEIDDLIVEGKDLNFIVNKFNLDTVEQETFSKSDIEKNSADKNKLPPKLINSIFKIDESDPTILLEIENEFFVVELIKSENFELDIADELVKKDILSKLSNQIKRKFISEIINKINNNNYEKKDFDKLSVSENVKIEKIKIENINDNKLLKQELVNQIYAYAEKKVIVVADIGFRESYLIYIDKIENIPLNQNPDNFKKYLILSKKNMANRIYNTYDTYLKNKYKIDINYKALDSINNVSR